MSPFILTWRKLLLGIKLALCPALFSVVKNIMSRNNLFRRVTVYLCIGQIEASTCPPPGNPPSIWLFWKLLFKFPHYPGQNAVQMPHTGVHSGDQMPPPRGHFTGTKMTEGWRAYACKIYATVEIHLNTVFRLPGHCARVRYSLGTNVNTPMTACSHNSGTVQVRVRGRDLVLGHDSGTESLCAHRTFLFGSGLIHCFVLSATLTFQNGVCQGEIE